MLGSELCSGKGHTHRMIEVSSVSHVAWAYCQTGKSFKMLKRGGEGRGCQPDNLRITHNLSLKLTYCIVNKNEMILAGMLVNIKYTVALFSALDVLVRKKNMRLARFSLHFARNLCCKRPRHSLYINLFHSLLPK